MLGSSRSGGSVVPIRQENTTPWGVSMGLTERMTLSVTRTTRAGPDRGGSSTPSVYSTAVTVCPHSSASFSSLGLSHRHSPDLSR